MAAAAEPDAVSIVSFNGGLGGRRPEGRVHPKAGARRAQGPSRLLTPLTRCRSTPPPLRRRHAPAEWGEGTQIEPAQPWRDALTGDTFLDYRPHGPHLYLNLTGAAGGAFRRSLAARRERLEGGAAAAGQGGGAGHSHGSGSSGSTEPGGGHGGPGGPGASAPEPDAAAAPAAHGSGGGSSGGGPGSGSSGRKGGPAARSSSRKSNGGGIDTGQPQRDDTEAENDAEL
jgi:hypothetical protein